jgi:hypothetical protein
MGKRKYKKGFSASWAGGVFGPAERERTRPRGQAAHSARQRGRRHGNGTGTVPWRGPTCQRKGG